MSGFSTSGGQCQWPNKVKMKVLVAQSCPTLYNLRHCSPPGSSVHGILQARILKWVAIPFSRKSSLPRDWTWVFCIAGRFFTIWVTRETHDQTRWVLISRFLWLYCGYRILSLSLHLCVCLCLSVWEVEAITMEIFKGKGA